MNHKELKEVEEVLSINFSKVGFMFMILCKPCGRYFLKKCVCVCVTVLKVELQKILMIS